MKFVIILAQIILFGISVRAHEHEHAHVFTPEQEKKYFKELGIEPNEYLKGVFPYKYWDECYDSKVQGNYMGYSCTDRMTSKILYKFLNDHLADCVAEGAASLNYTMYDYHVIHKGIYADARHSPRSLHAEGRAIDVATIVVNTLEKGDIRFIYKNHGNGRFFNNVRKCWGRRVSRYNQCPYYNGVVGYTGTIGKEHSGHQVHMHMSVPYCIQGNYAGSYYRR